MRFSEVLHQERALSLLRRALRSGRTPHAYLFDGPEGVGKELAARALAARLLCAAGGLAADSDACGRCESCLLVAADTHPDYHLVHRGLHKLHPERSVRQSQGLFLGVDLVRHFVIDPSIRTPSLGKRRVFVLRDAERMNEEAQNALLKTLEEPPGAACFILVTASAARLLATIRSRCQRVPFDLLPISFVAERLAAAGAGETEAATLAALSQGRMGAALRWRAIGLPAAATSVVDALMKAGTRTPTAFAESLLQAGEALAAAQSGASVEDDADESEEAAEEESAARGRGKTARVSTDAMREGMRLVLMVIAAACRDGLAVATSPDEAGGARGGAATGGMMLAGQGDAIRRLAGVGADRLADCVAAAAEAERMIDRNVAPQLACEWLAAALRGEAAVGSW